jgi:phytanoyl-CoA hydroxylase
MIDNTTDSADGQFDEEYYLAIHPDIRDGVAAGQFVNGYHHYRLHGRAEGRTCAPEFDAQWYARVYPMVAADLAQGRARDEADHWRQLGRYRGYLPNAAAPRPDNPSRMNARFGGLWTDAPDAHDIVAGRQSIGTLTDDDALRLSGWIDDGFIRLPGAIPAHLLDAACTDLERAYQGGMTALLFQCAALSADDIAWRPEIHRQPATALDLHWHSAATRDLIFAPEIVRFLHLIFERKPLAAQSAGFMRSPARPTHQCSATIAYSQARRFVTSWIALEDVTADGGELAYFPGSHTAPDFMYGTRYKSRPEAMRLNGAGSDGLDEAADQHSRALLRHIEAHCLPERRFLAKAGDVLIGHADLAHGDTPVSNHATRRSVVAQYCPADVAPASFEMGRSAVREYGCSGYYCTVVY